MSNAQIIGCSEKEEKEIGANKSWSEYTNNKVNFRARNITKDREVNYTIIEQLIHNSPNNNNSPKRCNNSTA